MNEVAEAFPLDWPDSWPRSEGQDKARYQTEFGKARNHVIKQLDLMGATYIVISSNVPLRNDGLPYATFGGRRYDDPGVAVYFHWRGDPQVVACDNWDHVKDNMRAIGLNLEALRMIERTGVTELLRRAFQGFKALPPASDLPVREPVVHRPWYIVLEVAETASREVINAVFKAKAKVLHPDAGGSDDEMSELVTARQEALRANGSG